MRVEVATKVSVRVCSSEIERERDNCRENDLRMVAVAVSVELIDIVLVTEIIAETDAELDEETLIVRDGVAVHVKVEDADREAEDSSDSDAEAEWEYVKEIESETVELANSADQDGVDEFENVSHRRDRLGLAE